MEPNETQVVTTAVRLAVLTSILGVAGALNAPTIIVYQHAVVLTPHTVLAALTVCTFVGYANIVAATWDAPYLDTDGSALVFGASQTIVCTAATTPNLCYGYAAADAGLTALKVAWNFSSPQDVSLVGSAVSFLPAFRYSGT